jgi:uncharacterized protein (TIGR02246 family)
VTTDADGVQSIDSLYDAWIAAFRSGDVDAALSLLTDDYVLWPANGPAMHGRAGLRPLLVQALAAYEIQPSFRSVERIVAGDLAIDLGWDEQTVMPRDGSPPRTQRQRVCLILRRDPVLGWRYARGIASAGPDV